MESTKQICEKWYKQLSFPAQYDHEFYKALDEIEISDAITIENYNLKETDGKRNLLSYLYFCESVSQRYKEKGIPEDILMHTLGDLVIWTNVWSDLKGELYLGEIAWLSNHMKMRLFRLGSLEFIARKSLVSSETVALSEGDNILDVHIPNGAPLSPDNCHQSIAMAKAFYAKYYPEFEYHHIVSTTWLLDPTLDRFVGPQSNIVNFRKMFTLIESHETYSAIRYVFKWNTTLETLPEAVCTSSLAEKMKQYVLDGGKLYGCSGVIKV